MRKQPQTLVSLCIPASRLLTIFILFALASVSQAQLPSDIEKILGQHEQKRQRQQAVFDAEMEKATKVAVVDLTRIAKAELRKNNLANAIIAWQAILKIDPKNPEAAREIETLRNAMAGKPAKELKKDNSFVGVEGGKRTMIAKD